MRSTLLNLLLAIAGAALLYVTVQRAGWGEVERSLSAIGWWFAAVVLLGGLRFAARAQAWVVCTEHQLRFADALRASLAGDALGNVTPLGLLASEPTKFFLVKDRLPTVAAVASVAAENAFYMASVLVMLSAGAMTFFARANVPPEIRIPAQAIVAAALIAGVAAVWVVRRQPAILTRLARVLATITGRAATSVDRLREIEVHFYALLRWPAGRLARVFFWEAMFHAGAVVEVYLVLRLIAPDATVLEAFVLETTGRLITVVFKFVPYRLGVDEAGTALVALALGLDARVGVTLALVRRMRVLAWNAVGLVVLALKRR